MPDVVDSAELMQGALESELPPERAMLEQTQELHVVTEAPDYRGTPTQLVDELLAELTTDKLVALVRQTERPIDEAVKAALARIRDQLSSANVPEDVLAKFDDFVYCTVSFAEVLQEDEAGAAPDPEHLTKRDKKARNNVVIGLLGAGAGLLLFAAFGLAENNSAVQSSVLVLLGLSLVGIVVTFYVTQWVRR